MNIVGDPVKHEVKIIKCIESLCFNYLSLSFPQKFEAELSFSTMPKNYN